jgi:hypothetical protein
MKSANFLLAFLIVLAAEYASSQSGQLAALDEVIFVPSDPEEPPVRENPKVTPEEQKIPAGPEDSLGEDLPIAPEDLIDPENPSDIEKSVAPNGARQKAGPTLREENVEPESDPENEPEGLDEPEGPQNPNAKVARPQPVCSAPAIKCGVGAIWSNYFCGCYCYPRVCPAGYIWKRYPICRCEICTQTRTCRINYFWDFNRCGCYLRCPGVTCYGNSILNRATCNCDCPAEVSRSCRRPFIWSQLQCKCICSRRSCPLGYRLDRARCVCIRIFF